MVTEIVQTGAAPRGNPAQTTRTKAGLSSDFETFLNMLTAQARYQDPLEPLDSSQYAAQLAQFSMVEQQVQTNDMLTALVSQLGGASMTELAGWIGMEARSYAPAHYRGEPITVVPQVADGAERAVLVIRDSTGEEVERRGIGTDGEPLDWTGAGGLAHGLYSFSTESYRANELLADLAMPSYRRIAEARFENGMVLLELAGGGVIRAEDVIGLREGG